MAPFPFIVNREPADDTLKRDTFGLVGDVGDVGDMGVGAGAFCRRCWSTLVSAMFQGCTHATRREYMYPSLSSSSSGEPGAEAEAGAAWPESVLFMREKRAREGDDMAGESRLGDLRCAECAEYADGGTVVAGESGPPNP